MMNMPWLAPSAKLVRDIQAAGHEVWFDDWKIDLGDSIVGRVNEGLEGMSYLVLCYSSSGMSDWVDREWMSALSRQLSGQQVKILPVLLSGGKSPAILADIKYANLFKDWSKEMQVLLKSIK